MNIALNVDQRLSFCDAKDVMAGKLRALKNEKISLSAEESKIIRLQIKIQPQLILSWLAQQKHETLFYWADREGKFQIGGVGVADWISQQSLNYDLLIQQIRKKISGAPEGVCYYGGIAFDPQNLDREWNDFGVCNFLIPRFELLSKEGETSFACNLLLQNNNPEEFLNDVEAELEGINVSKVEGKKEIPSLINRQDFPDYTSWSTIVTEALDSLKVGEHEKIVLARKSVLKLNAKLNPFLFLKEIEAKNNRSFHFCFQPTKTSAFLGASPERLYQRCGNLMKSEAIAGTRPRGEPSLENQKLKKELLNSAKDIQEHEYVYEFIQAQFKKLCSKFQATEHLSILELQEGMHLVSRFGGTLKNDFSDAEVLKSLHPTPAVAGTPAHWAVDAISFYEPFSRGWYAGPVGWVGKDSAEFVVAIRSGLVHDDQISLFSGAGIVKGSTPQNEWDEIENKMSSFMRMFRNEF